MENKKLKGEIGTGHILEIIEIILISVIIMGLLGIAGLNFGDLTGMAGSILSDLWGWFTTGNVLNSILDWIF